VIRDDIEEGQWLHSLEETIRLCNAMIVFVDDDPQTAQKDIQQGLKYNRPLIIIYPSGKEIPPDIKRLHEACFIQSELETELVKKLEDELYGKVKGMRDYEKSDLRRRMHWGLLVGDKRDTILFQFQDEIISVDKLKGLLPEEKKVLFDAKNFYQRKLFDDAINLLDKFLKDHPKCNNEEINFLLSDCWFLKGEGSDREWEKRNYYEMLLKTAQEGLQRCPDSLILKKNFGIGLLKIGLLDKRKDKLEEGKKVFDELIQKSPNSILFHYNLACIAAIEENVPKVLEHLKGAIKIEESIRILARIDPDFDKVWRNQDFQDLIFGKTK
jgi:tetratricopeptide (TPR) repeat protein